MRAVRTSLLLAVLVFLGSCLAGCGTSSYKTYTDATFKFSFQYPSSWSTPVAKEGIADNVQSHIVNVSGGTKAIRVVVNDRIVDFSPIKNGQTERQGPNTLVFTRLQVAGRPAVRMVQNSPGLPPDHEYVHFNTARYGYDIEMASANGIGKSEQAVLDHAVSTFKVGTQG